MNKSGNYLLVSAIIACVGLAACSNSGEAENSSQFEISSGEAENSSQVEISADDPAESSESTVGAESADDSTEQSVPTTPVTTLTTAVQPVPPSGPLTATPPAAAISPDRNSHRVVRAGDGPSILEGDTVGLEYVMVSWSTGQVVLSTEDEFGGPRSIVLGELEVPRYLENSVFGEPVGSRLQVIYGPNLEDLPAGLDPSDAYLLAVDIVSRG